MDFVIQHDFAQQRDALANIRRNQIPFATSLAINAMARAAKDALPETFERLLSRPKPFTTRSSIFTINSTKATLQATVGIKDKQAEYLAAILAGGSRRLKVSEQRFMGRYFVPGKAAPIDSYGNVSKANQLAILRAAVDGSDWRGKRIVVLKQARDGLPAGVYAAPKSRASRRSSQGLALLLLFVDRSPSYSRIIQFDTLVAKIVADGFSDAFVSAMDRAEASSL